MISSMLTQPAPSRSGMPWSTVAASLATISEPAISAPAVDPDVGVGVAVLQDRRRRADDHGLAAYRRRREMPGEDVRVRDRTHGARRPGVVDRHRCRRAAEQLRPTPACPWSRRRSRSETSRALGPSTASVARRRRCRHLSSRRQGPACPSEPEIRVAAKDVGLAVSARRPSRRAPCGRRA